MKSLLSWHGEGWSAHIGIPRCWGWTWGYDAGDTYSYVLRQFGLGPFFLFVWEP